MATATIRCPGCGQEIMRGAAVECNFKPSVQATTFQQSFERAQERHWLCMECKYIVENRYGDMSSVTSEDAYTLLYSVRIKKGSNCCNSCTIIQLNCCQLAPNLIDKLETVVSRKLRIFYSPESRPYFDLRMVSGICCYIKTSLSVMIFFLLITCLLDYVLRMWGEIGFWLL